MKKLFAQSFAIIRQHKRAYIILNLAYAGFYIAGLIAAYLFPDLHAAVNKQILFMVDTSIRFAPQKEYYFTNQNFILAVLATFIPNLLISCLILVSISSTIIPFLGCLLAAVKFFYFGIWSPEAHVYPILVLEFLPTVLAAFGVYVHYTRLFKPKKYGIASHKQGFIEGLKLQVRLYPLVIALWLIAAIVESAIVFSMKVTRQDPFIRAPQAQAQAADDSVKTYHTNATVYFDTAKIAEADARVAGVYLEDIFYFEFGKKGSARVSERDGFFTLELGIPKDNWNSKITRGILIKLKSKLKEYSPSKKIQIVMVDVDKNGDRIEQIFKE